MDLASICDVESYTTPYAKLFNISAYGYLRTRLVVGDYFLK
jgi:hypothetical protein